MEESRSQRTTLGTWHPTVDIKYVQFARNPQYTFGPLSALRLT